ncbi:aldehyde dehydrogenase family protein [Microcella alkalica]|uniref:Aldehyde dehydrogenase (NAD(P)+) n=1 Tax=Microcella alkalica TaxID=355930 RepID=A0A839EBI9_9MICO|nr:aldehyde dehydrogenase family protein [Microcella alkalica]MBA8848576.1 aldehyde dehydrogenase (NAD(P)+) [Microcella alkalica]
MTNSDAPAAVARTLAHLAPPRPLPTALDSDLAALRRGAAAWVAGDLAEKRALLPELRRATLAAAAEWVAAACAVKRIDPESPAAGEEWSSGPYAVITATSALEKTLRTLERGGTPLTDRRVGRAPQGRIAVRAFPYLPKDVVLTGYSADVWLRHGVSIEDARAGIAGALRDRDRAPLVTAVLGAGNITGIPALDVLTALYQEASAAVVKLNPVNARVGGALRAAFAPAIERDLVRIVEGDNEVGQALIHHPDVDRIHITGSRSSHDTIVFGADPDREERRREQRPVLDKPISSELGGVGPVIVVPGGADGARDRDRWTDNDLDTVARGIATERLHNSGFNCIATQLVVIPAEWEHADALVAKLRGHLAAAPPRTAYYPGAAERRDAAVAGHPDAVSLGGDPLAARALVDHLDPVDESEPLFTTEVFGPVLGVVRVPSSPARDGALDPAAFLDAAVAFCNARLAGTLGAGIVIHPRTRRALRGALDAAIATLEYGTVGVNCWVGPLFGMPGATWGAFPGHEVHEVGSGIGVVHNALLLDPAHVERTVGHGPWHPTPTPLWSVDNRTSHVTAERLTRFAGDGSASALPAAVATIASYVRG